MDFQKLLNDGIAGGLVVVLYFLIRKLLVPLAEAAIKRRIERTEADQALMIPPSEDRRLEAHAESIRVLELNLTALTAQVVEFDKLIATVSAAVDGKLDIVLEELKELRDEQTNAMREILDRFGAIGERFGAIGERIGKLETKIENIQETYRRAGN